MPRSTPPTRARSGAARARASPGPGRRGPTSCRSSARPASRPSTRSWTSSTGRLAGAGLRAASRRPAGGPPRDAGGRCRRPRRAARPAPARSARSIDHLEAEVAWAAREELALGVADVLVRRTRLAQELPDRGAAIAPRVAEILAGELGWTKRRRQDEVGVVPRPGPPRLRRAGRRRRQLYESRIAQCPLGRQSLGARMGLAFGTRAGATSSHFRGDCGNRESIHFDRHARRFV